jgi:hypothetical protein
MRPVRWPGAGPVTPAFRDGHTETWYAAGAALGLVEPRRRPAPGGGHRRPGHPACQGQLVSGHQPAPARRPGRDRADLRHPALDRAKHKQVKDQLGQADFQVRSDTAIRRHQALVNCAFSFCWDAWFHDHPAPHEPEKPRTAPGRGERGAARRLTAARTVLAAGTARDTRLAFPLDRTATLVAGMVQSAAAAPGPDQLGRGRPRPAPLHPELTNYR